MFACKYVFGSLPPSHRMIVRQWSRTPVVCGLVMVLAGWNHQTVAESPAWASFQNGGFPNLDEADYATTWSPESNIAWTADIVGYGQSTPIVAHGQIVVTSTSGENKDNYHVSSFDVETGKPNWQTSRGNPSPFKNSPMVSRAAPSAVATESGFVAFFEGGLLLGLSKAGDVTWEVDLVKQYGPIEARHGLAASLETDGQRAFVWVERQEEPYVLAVEPSSGEEIWKVPGIGTTSWGSPRLIQVGDQQHLVCSGSGRIVGYQPETGQQLWDFDDISGNTSCTPVPAGNGQFIIGASSGRQERNAGAAAENNALLRISRTEAGDYEVSKVWRAEKATSTFGSPIVVGSTAAFVSRAGVLYQLDLETGQKVATMRIDAGGIWATPITLGDHLYLFGYKGTTSVINWKTGDEVATNRCWEAGADSPGFGGGNVLYAAAVTPKHLVLRRGDKLYAVGKE